MKKAFGQTEYIVSFRLETFVTHLFWRISMTALTLAEDGTRGIVRIILISK